MTRDEHIDHDPTDKVERYHTDPTRAARIAEAIRLTRPLVPGILSLIERVLGNDPTAEEPLKAAVSAAYERPAMSWPASTWKYDVGYWSTRW